MSIEIIDNFLDKEYFNEFKSQIEGYTCPWYYRDDITTGEYGNNLCKYGFNHVILNDDGQKTSNFDLFGKFFYKMMEATGSKVIVRSRLDMTLNMGKSIVLEPHVDFFFKHISSIFYVNNSDGNTLIYNQRYNEKDRYNQELTVKQEIEPRANRLLIFDGLLIHTGSTPSKHNRRILINTNFKYR
tara:strand:- start:50 stop:604 length:555 start_codon:yes stop_codon:yes gene_type:complete